MAFCVPPSEVATSLEAAPWSSSLPRFSMALAFALSQSSVGILGRHLLLAVFLAHRLRPAAKFARRVALRTSESRLRSLPARAAAAGWRVLVQPFGPG